MKHAKTLLTICALMALLISCSTIGGASNAQNEAQNQQLQSTITALENQVQQLTSQQQEQQQSAPPAPQQPAPVVPTAEAAAAPNSPVTLPQPTAESLPTAPVPAGMPVIYDGWSVSVSQELNIGQDRNSWGVDIIVRNLTDTSRVFRYMNASVTASDDLGNVYKPVPQAPYMGGTSCEAEYYLVRNLQIDGVSNKILSSGTSGNGCLHEDGIGMFLGTIPMDASQLTIHLDDFGPLTNVDFVMDL